MKVKINPIFSVTMSNDKQCILYIEVPLSERKTVDKFADEVLRLKDKEITLEVKQHRAQRTLTQNAYYWSLVGKLKDVLRTSEDELHITLLQRYGQPQTDDNGEIVIFSLRSDINTVGILKYSKFIGKGEVNGTEFSHYKALKGSSDLNTSEMNILIDGLISECKEIGIETDTPSEIARLKDTWQKKDVSSADEQTA